VSAPEPLESSPLPVETVIAPPVSDAAMPAESVMVAPIPEALLPAFTEILPAPALLPVLDSPVAMLISPVGPVDVKPVDKVRSPVTSVLSSLAVLMTIEPVLIKPVPDSMRILPPIPSSASPPNCHVTTTGTAITNSVTTFNKNITSRCGTTLV